MCTTTMRRSDVSTFVHLSIRLSPTVITVTVTVTVSALTAKIGDRSQEQESFSSLQSLHTVCVDLLTTTDVVTKIPKISSTLTLCNRENLLMGIFVIGKSYVPRFETRERKSNCKNEFPRIDTS
jgi:hypothetical protein